MSEPGPSTLTGPGMNPYCSRITPLTPRRDAGLQVPQDASDIEPKTRGPRPSINRAGQKLISASFETCQFPTTEQKTALCAEIVAAGNPHYTVGLVGAAFTSMRGKSRRSESTKYMSLQVHRDVITRVGRVPKAPGTDRLNSAGIALVDEYIETSGSMYLTDHRVETNLLQSIKNAGNPSCSRLTLREHLHNRRRRSTLSSKTTARPKPDAVASKILSAFAKQSLTPTIAEKQALLEQIHNSGGAQTYTLSKVGRYFSAKRYSARMKAETVPDAGGESDHADELVQDEGRHADKPVETENAQASRRVHRKHDAKLVLLASASENPNPLMEDLEHVREKIKDAGSETYDLPQSKRYSKGRWSRVHLQSTSKNSVEEEPDAVAGLIADFASRYTKPTQEELQYLHVQVHGATSKRYTFRQISSMFASATAARPTRVGNDTKTVEHGNGSSARVEVSSASEADDHMEVDEDFEHDTTSLLSSSTDLDAASASVESSSIPEPEVDATMELDEGLDSYRVDSFADVSSGDEDGSAMHAHTENFVEALPPCQSGSSADSIHVLPLAPESPIDDKSTDVQEATFGMNVDLAISCASDGDVSMEPSPSNSTSIYADPPSTDVTTPIHADENAKFKEGVARVRDLISRLKQKIESG